MSTQGITVCLILNISIVNSHFNREVVNNSHGWITVLPSYKVISVVIFIVGIFTTTPEKKEKKTHLN